MDTKNIYMKNFKNSNKLVAKCLSVVLVLALATGAIIYLSNNQNDSFSEVEAKDYFTDSINKHNKAMDKLHQQEIQKERQKEMARVIAERKKREEELARKKEQERLAKIAKLEKERQAERERLNKIAIAKTEEKRKQQASNKTSKPVTVSRSNDYKGANVNLGTFNVSWYGNNCTGCSGITASGVSVKNSIYHKGYGVAAADWSVIPPNSVIEVEGYGMYIVIDKGGAIKGHRLDILTTSEAKASQYGRQHLKVTLIKRGS